MKIGKYTTKSGRRYKFIIEAGNDPITGKRKQIKRSGFTSLKDADQALRKLLIEVEKNRFLDPSEELFDSYINFWFNNIYKTKVKETTFSTRKYLVEKHLLII